MIKCRVIYNDECLKCKCVKKEMVKIGAFYMCYKCYLWEFGKVTEFDPESRPGRIYYKWLKIYNEEI